MARPSVLRADTLDLQDQSSPSAAEHPAPNPLQPNGLAPNAAAQVDHVRAERNSEEQSLADAWNIADSLIENPSAIEQAQAKNAANSGSGEEDGDGGDQDDTDDDMMDRISSSPSIDDGGYTLHSPPFPAATLRRVWPIRSSSVSPTSSLTPTRETFNQSALSSPGSSPFTQTPQHLPVRARMVEIQRKTPFTPAYSSGTTSFTAPQHHLQGRYGQYRESGSSMEDTSGSENGSAIFEDEYSRHSIPEHVNEAASAWPEQRRQHDLYSNPRPIESPFRHHVFAPGLVDLNGALLEQSPSLNSIVSVDIGALLLPTDDPLLEAPCSPDGSASSWESLSGSDSDARKAEDTDDGDDDADGAFLNLDDRFIDSGWGGECLREVEDIDFEFVYALHTFVATVEGQANATKGDTMVLLDDSNSYWWLVRVVKDSSIGYLPAEHIETPTERLARLNKHRNIDLSATMLSDNSEKSRNPLKKAMSRRKTKTVQFAAPTYVEASDYDYSSSDDEDNMIDPYGNALQSDNGAHADEEAVSEEPKAEAKDTTAEGRSSTSSNRASFDREQAATAAQALAAAGVKGDQDPVSPKLIDKTGEFEIIQSDSDGVPTNATEAAPLKSKRTRNTDSFLKDDTIETRKITLTPGILRDESGSLKSPIAEEPKRSNSLEPLTKVSTPPEQLRKDVKEKKEPKKGGLLSGLFKSKKKDKKSKDDASSDTEKLSTEISRESPRASPLPSETTSPVDNKYITGLQFPAAGKGNLERRESGENVRGPSTDSNGGFVAELPGSEVAYEMATGQESGMPESQLTRADLEAMTMPTEKSSSLSNALSPLTNLLTTNDKETKPKKAKRAKQRVELDDFDTPPGEVSQDPFDDRESTERLSESPVEISANTFMHGTESIHIPTPELGDEEDAAPDEPGSLTSSPSLIDHPAEPLEVDEIVEDNDPTPTALSPQPQPSESRAVEDAGQTAVVSSIDTNPSRVTPQASPAVSQQSWSDKGLRAWLEDGTEVRDMLVMINDKTGVKPAPADHPLMSGLFVEERKGVQDMMGQLDGLLGSYLQRKGVQF